MALQRIKVLYFLLLSISPMSYGQDTSIEDETESPSYTLITEKLTSKVLSEERTVVVQLPKSYAENPDKKYPIIYRLDGAITLVMLNAVLESLQFQRAALA